MPQVAQTFTRYDASYPFMNEKASSSARRRSAAAASSTTTKA